MQPIEAINGIAYMGTVAIILIAIAGIYFINTPSKQNTNRSKNEQ